MENQNTISLQVPCPLHSSETIQRVSLDKNTNHHIYCLECILQHKSQSGEASQTLKPISEFIDAAASLYAKKREDVNFGDQVPEEMAEILTVQAEKLETLTQHIKQEKERVSSLFDSISQELFKTIEEKKTETLYKLDQQIFNLRFWFISFDKQLKKTYPTPQDIPILYPAKEDLITKLAKITNATQLTALVKSLKDDLNEVDTSSKDNDRTLELQRKVTIHHMSKQILEVSKLRPSYHTEDLDLQKLKQDLREKVSDLMKQTWNLQSPIPEATTESTPESAFLKPQDFSRIKSWLPQNLLGSPKLLYRGSRDGMDGPTFHKLCDGKENTLTVIKAVFHDQDVYTESVFGGYLDKPWHSNGGFIHSADAFLFSLTKDVKCPLAKNKGQYAASANANHGPCFGGGYDIGLWTKGTGMACTVYPHSYLKTKQLIEGIAFSTGEVYMDVLEVEVYSIN